MITGITPVAETGYSLAGAASFLMGFGEGEIIVSMKSFWDVMNFWVTLKNQDFYRRRKEK